MKQPAPGSPAPWLSLHAGTSPLLVIALHAGQASAEAQSRHLTERRAERRAEPAEPATPPAPPTHPKINDLHTGDIALELARRLDASALVNHGMDRNRLDCNRSDQLAREAPWFLDLLAEQVEELLRRHRRLLILSIHGWNVVQPRIDFGLGARAGAGDADGLIAVGSAHLTASRQFIRGPLAQMAAALRAAAIEPSIGFRYPAGDRRNLMQLFTLRFTHHPLGAVRRLAELAGGGALQALQLELSVAVRWPGPIRETALEILSSSLRQQLAAPEPRLEFSLPPPRRATDVPTTPRSAHPGRRFGLECFDPANGFGLMATIDLSGGASRVAFLFERHRIAICTAEGAPEIGRSRLALGPLVFTLAGKRLTARFQGPMLTVPEASAYVRLERAFRLGSLAPRVDVECVFEMPREIEGFQELDGFQELPGLVDALAGEEQADNGAGAAPEHERQPAALPCFGAMHARVRLNGADLNLSGLGRLGYSLAGFGGPSFTRRSSVWAHFTKPGASIRSLELRSLREAGKPAVVDAVIFDRTGKHAATLVRLRPVGLDSSAAHSDSAAAQPAALEAELSIAGRTLLLRTEPRCFMALSRPGLDGERIHTTVGFGLVHLAGARDGGDGSDGGDGGTGGDGAGMFEYSRTI